MHARSVDGGVDRIPLPDTPGELWLCGKHAIGPDPDRLLTALGLSTVVCLTRRHELADRYPAYVAWLDAHVPDGRRAVWFPTHDLGSHSLSDTRPVLDGLVGRLQRGERLVIHCAAGIGRAGTLAVGLAILQGMGLVEALAHVRAHRPMAGPEVGAQLALVTELAAGLAAQPGR